MRWPNVPRGILVAAGGGALIAAGLALWPLPAPVEPPAAGDPRVTTALHQTRQPAETETSQRVRMARPGGTAPTASLPTAPTLVGVTGFGPQARAWLRGIAGDVVPLTVGGDLDGWRLTRIGSGSARVAKGGEERLLELFATSTSLRPHPLQ